MIKRYFLMLVFMVVGTVVVLPQVDTLDSFTDGNFTSTPVWGGDTGAWTIVASSDVAAGATGSNTLRLNFTTGSAGTQYLSTQISTWGDEQAWGFFVGRRAQAFTGSNQMIIWLYANESNLESATVDGYRIVIGDDTGNDEIVLQYILNGAVSATVITSSGAITNGLTDIGFLLRVTRSSSGVWTMYTSTLPTASGTGAVATDIPNSSNANVNQGSATNNTLVPAADGYFGVVAVHTSGTNARFTVELDQVLFTATSAATPSITLADNGTQIGAGNVDQGATDHILSTFKVTVADANATLNSLTFNAGGTFAAGDITNFELFTNTTNSFPGGTALKTVSAGGIANGDAVSFTSLSQACNIGDRYFWITADVSGSATASNTVSVPSLSNSNFSFASGTVSGTITAGGAQTIQAVTPSISLSSPTATDEDITIGNNNNVIYRFDLAVTVANATLNGVTITTSGTYSASDLTNLKCWYSTDNTFNEGSDVLLSTKTASLGAGSHVFPSFISQTINSGSTGYIFITTDLPYTATPGVTISVNAITTGDISFVSGTKSGTANASGTKTLIDCTPVNVTGASATADDAQVTVSFTLPSCYTEIMIVAKPTSSVGASPSGDGSAYTANLTFGSGTAFDGTGYVVYKGTTSPQTVTGLTNGTTYYFKIFTRRGSTWSSGSEVNATPTGPTLLLTDNFNFTGNLTDNGWSAHSSGGTNSIGTTTGLTYAGYANSGVGNAAQIGNAGGEDVNMGFTDQNTNGKSVYLSCLVNVNETASDKTGDYFLHLGDRVSATSFTSFAARVFVKVVSENVNFGISNSTTATYGSTNYAKNTTYLLIVKYTINTGGNDEVKLWVKSSGVPENETAAGTPEVTNSSTAGQDVIDAIGLRQGSNTTSVSIIVDGIRISDGWGEAPLPVELTFFSAKSVKGGVALTWQTATEVNNYGFEIQRSGNRDQETGNSWDVIGFVPGNGNSNSEKSYSFTDRNVANATKYFYRLKQIDTDGKYDYSKEVEVITAMSESFELVQNYPNPFNPSTVISYHLTQNGNVKLTVFDILGKEIATLVNGKKDAGSHTVNFNASGLQSGIYFYKITVTSENGSLLYSSTNKMSLIK